MAEYRIFPKAPSGPTPIEDLTDQRFDELIALHPYTQRSAAGRICWVCRCSCGCEVAYEAHALKRGFAKTCGRRELHK